MSIWKQAFPGWRLWDINNGIANDILPDKILHNFGMSNKRNIINLQSKYKRHFGTIGSFTFTEWKYLVDFYCGNNFICLACGNSGFIIPDHIQSVSLGGTNNIDNIQPICEKCNNKKGNKYVDYRINFWINKIMSS